MIKAGIVGGTGYTGAELLRLLVAHPAVGLQCITSRQEAGRAVAEVFPQLRGFVDLSFVAPDVETLSACDVVFFATPHGTAMKAAPELLERGVKVIDLSADFRLRDTEVFSKWYGMPHTAPDALAEAVYGLPEWHRAALREARLVGNPGCYPTAVQLGLLPLLERDCIDVGNLVADCKSGVTGAGREAKVATLYSEVTDSLRPYGVAGHRHGPEIEQGLNAVSAAKPVDLIFTPHLIPMQRGILATLHVRLTRETDLQALFESRYADEAFVDVLPAGVLPETRNVRGSNRCQIAVVRPGSGDRAVVMSVIDNVVKGASGQAVQCMNVMFGRPETEGLMLPALWP
jgi:N-acetyl-gamma-glutamyl-phosphate reductase